MAYILIVDDEAQIRSTLKNALSKRGHQVVTAEDGQTASEFFKAGFDLIFLDIKLPDANGIDLLKSILESNRQQIVVMISGHADINTAIEAIKLGAYEFIEKPLSLDRILITIDNAMKADRLKQSNVRLTTQLYGEFIGENQKIKQLKADIARSASRTSRFLILGENGTGKELAAHMIHRSSNFSDGPFVAVNCAALPENLIEAELFGHTAGAFTGATKARKGKFLEANSGSIFLDEISEMPLEAQAKILRAVESKNINPIGSEKSFDINLNIIAASNKDLERLVAENKFRQDLLYRLNVVTFELPPLRERTDDIPLLVDYFLNIFAVETKKAALKLSKDALTVLSAFEFPGNIRELKNLLERINIYCEGPIVERDEIKEFFPYIPQTNSNSLKEAVAEFEKKKIVAAIDKANGNIAQAAKELSIERSHLYKKMRKYNINFNN